MTVLLVVIVVLACGLWVVVPEMLAEWARRRPYRQIDQIRRQTMDQIDQAQEAAWQRRLHESQAQVRRFAKEHDL